MRRTLTVGIALMVVAVGLTVGSAAATPGSGTIISDPVASATIADKFEVRHNAGEGVQVLRLTFTPGSHNGWHTHPGKAVVAIQSGSLTLHRASDPTCDGTTYTAGQGFVEYPSSVHLASNEGSTDVVLAVVFFDVPPGTSPRIDQPNPGSCEF